MKYSQLMFHSAERTVAMDVTVPQAVYMDPSSSSAFQLRFLPYATFGAPPSAVCQQESTFRSSPRSDLTSEAMFDGSQHQLPSSAPGSPAAVRVTACPESLNAKHPTSWSKDGVEEWLDWSVKEFELDDVQRKRFSMNGKALCILSKEGFRYRAPNAGDFLYDLLQKLLTRGTPFNQSATDMQMTPSVSANEETALNFQRHRRTPPSYKQGDEFPTGPAYDEPTSRFRTSDKFNRDHYKSSDDGEQPSTPEPLPLNLKITDIAHESSSSSGHSTPYAALDMRNESQQSPRPMAAVHFSYPPYLPPYPTVHPKTLQEPSVPESSAHHDTPTGQDPRRHIHSPAQCPSLPSRKSPANHSSSGNLNRKRNHPPYAYYAPSLPHRQSHTGADFEEDYNPQRKHRREMMEAHLSSSEGHPSGDVSFDNRPVLLDILTRRGGGPSSVLPYNQMKEPGKVHVPVIQETAAFSTNGNTCTGGITNCTANQRSASRSLDSLAHHQRDIVPLAPFSRQYPYLLAPSVGQALTCERSTPSVFPNMFDVKILGDPKVEADTLEMDCDAKKDGARKKKGIRPLLWQFLGGLLKDKTHLHSICWEDEACRVFRINDTEKVAKLWGREKNRLNMTYEKMSRAMRYYYNNGILRKEPGQKLTYRFLTAPEDLANSRRIFKNKMKTNATYDAESTEVRIRQEVDASKSVSSSSSPRDPESADGTSTPGSSASTPTVASSSSPRCDPPIVSTLVTEEDIIKIKKERDDLGVPL